MHVRARCGIYMSPLRTLNILVTQYGCHEGHSTTNHLEYNTLLPSPRGRVRALTATTTGNNSSKYTGKNRGAQLARRQNWTRDAYASAQKTILLEFSKSHIY